MVLAERILFECSIYVDWPAHASQLRSAWQNIKFQFKWFKIIIISFKTFLLPLVIRFVSRIEDELFLCRRHQMSRSRLKVKDLLHEKNIHLYFYRKHYANCTSRLNVSWMAPQHFLLKNDWFLENLTNLPKKMTTYVNSIIYASTTDLALNVGEDCHLRSRWF